MSGYEESKPEVGTILNDYVQNEYKLSMWIPKDLGGKVIGKRGVVITNLQRETKAKQINALQPVGNSLWIAVVILGGYKNIISAYNSISEIVDDEVDGVVLEFMINYKKPFFLYGPKKFGIIKRLSAETNVRIFFPEFNVKEQNFSEALPVSLEGECVDVQRAVVELEKEAVNYRAAMNLKYGSNRPEREDRYEERETTREVRHSAPHHVDREVSNLTQSLKAGARVTTREPPRLIDTKALSSHSESPVPTPNSATKAQRIFELVNQNNQNSAREEVNDDEEEVVKATRKFEKSIEVPSTLVGLLLSKKPRTKVTTLNVIQSMTHTIISKIINPDTIQEMLVEDRNDRGRRRRAVSDSDDSEAAEDSAEDSADEARRNNARNNKTGRVTHTYVNDEKLLVTFKVLGWTEEAVDMVIDHLQRIIDGDRIKEVIDDLRHTSKSLGHRPSARHTSTTNTSYGYHKQQHGDNTERTTSAPLPKERVVRNTAPRYTEVDSSTVTTTKSRGLVVNAPHEQEHHPRGEPREHREPRVKHTAEGAIFGGPAPFNRGGRGGGRGRADFAGGRGRDFGKDTAPPADFEGVHREGGGRGGRGAGRGGRGRGRGRGGDRDDSPPRERKTEGW